MLDRFRIQTASGRFEYAPSYFVGKLRLWTCRNLDNRLAPIETRRLSPTASRREIIAAFRQ